MHSPSDSPRDDAFRQRPRVFPARTIRRRLVDPAGTRVVLWRLRGAIEELVCLAVTTSFGYALGLELGSELVLLELQPTLELLVERSVRLERWLLTRGWIALDDEITAPRD